VDRTELLVNVIVNAYKNGNKVLICGNGGSCADSEHFAAELMGKYAFDVRIPCLALTANTSLLTALANDYGYENVFSEQIKVLGELHDIYIGMTTSKSENIVRALAQAKKKGMDTVIICGGKYIKFESDYTFIMQGNDTAEIQNETIKFLHTLAFEVKRRLV
jgi:D-sedoheptulose 7-phosphate isomerase